MLKRLSTIFFIGLAFIIAVGFLSLFLGAVYFAFQSLDVSYASIPKSPDVDPNSGKQCCVNCLCHGDGKECSHYCKLFTSTPNGSLVDHACIDLCDIKHDHHIDIVHDTEEHQH